MNTLKNPNLYMEKWGFKGIYIIFLNMVRKMDCGYMLEPPKRGSSDKHHIPCLEQK